MKIKRIEFRVTHRNYWFYFLPTIRCENNETLLTTQFVFLSLLFEITLIKLQ